MHAKQVIDGVRDEWMHPLGDFLAIIEDALDDEGAVMLAVLNKLNRGS